MGVFQKAALTQNDDSWTGCDDLLKMLELLSEQVIFQTFLWNIIKGIFFFFSLTPTEMLSVLIQNVLEQLLQKSGVEGLPR